MQIESGGGHGLRAIPKKKALAFGAISVGRRLRSSTSFPKRHILTNSFHEDERLRMWLLPLMSEQAVLDVVAVT